MVSRRQLLAAGLSADRIRTRVARGSLVPLHRGVYAVGHRRLRREGTWLAAVLAAGPGAVLSHRDAAGLHGIRPANHREVDVTTAAARRPQPGIRLHRGRLPAREVTAIAGIPVTALPRTIVDLATTVPADHLARALSDADRDHRLDGAELERIARRTRTRNRGARAALQAVLADHRAHGLQLLRSELEAAFRTLVREHGLPRPRLNAMVHGREVDAWWPHASVGVEADGWAFHRSRRAFQRDRDKTNDLAARGITLLRFTHHDIAHRPHHVARVLRPLLGPGPAADG